MAIEVKWIAEDEIIEKLRIYSKKLTGSSKALSGTINRILKEYLNEKSDDSPQTSKDTRTHTKKGIEDILDWIEENNPSGITKSEIERAIKDTKGMDTRTVKKYEPEVIDSLVSKGYKPHPYNPNLFIRYELSPDTLRTP
jgi:hypothetical protein